MAADSTILIAALYSVIAGFALMVFRDRIKKLLGKTDNSEWQNSINSREEASIVEEASTTEQRSTAIRRKAPLPRDTSRGTTSREAAVARNGKRGSANKEPIKIAEGSNANVNKIKSCQDADVTNNEDWGLKVLLEPRNKDNIIEYFTHYLVQPILSPCSIVAVHGIGADPKDTWTIKKGGSRVDWLQDEAMLPKLVPNARIMRFGYNARWFGSSNTQHTKTFVRHVSNELLTQLYSFRKVSNTLLL